VPTAVAGITAFIVLVGILVIFHFRERDRETGISDAPSSEISVSSENDLSRKISLLDQCLYGALFKAGLSRNDIVSTHKAPRSAGGNRWELKTIRITLPKAVSFKNLKNYFTPNHLSFPLDVSRKFTRSKSDLLTMDVMLKGITTHSIMFSRPRKYASLPPPQKQKPPPVPVTGRVAIIIDDIGLAKEPAMEIMELNAPIALSLFPLAPFSREIAEVAHAKGFNVMLHVPLEPRTYPHRNPGPGALYTSMDSSTMVAQLTTDINSVPHVKGINNHMGSLFTEDEASMATLLKWIKGKGLFFVDSRTTPLTVGHRLAVRMGIPSAERRVFLDNEQNVEAILAKIDELGDIAINEGKAIGIGHPRQTTITALQKGIPRLRSRGLKLVPVSEMLE